MNERQAALQELVDSMARALARLEARMNPPRAHYCSAVVVRTKPGGGRSIEECRKLALVQRPDRKGFWCAEHARMLLPATPPRRDA